ncbi:hypothetical protein DFH07DRAFT_797527 [Mycena maculata]|uniref:F-box domain-containing protein n=1 Tax=Mycena maculata TaxID=230809 RepID=A0AAD7K3Y9_9AGAR|nr:hypothetical protein DFH07DRAFT_797527 [Mycena maculata]
MAPTSVSFLSIPLHIRRHPMYLLDTPIERSPDEVLALIFKVAADMPLGRREQSVPLTVSAVSRRWRTVALSSPELWTTIHVSHRRSTDHATLFLKRSTPLLFRMTVNTQSRGKAVEAAEILELFVRHIQRCSALALCLTDEELRWWNTALQHTTSHTLRVLSLTIHSHPPEELYGPPESPFIFATIFPRVSSIRLALAPTMLQHEPLDSLRLTTLNVRCTWDGGYLRHMCRHSPALDTLVLREYSASVFEGAPVACMPTLTHLVLEYKDAALAEGLSSLALSLELPNLVRLEVKGSRTPYAWYKIRALDHQTFPELRFLHLHDVCLGGALDLNILHTLGAKITHLRLTGEPFNSLNKLLSPTIFPDLQMIEVPRGSSSGLPKTWPKSVTLRLISGHPWCYLPGEIAFYEDGVGHITEFEWDIPWHLCSDFCEVHNTSPWRDARSAEERSSDQVLTRTEGLRPL